MNRFKRTRKQDLRRRRALLVGFAIAGAVAGGLGSSRDARALTDPADCPDPLAGQITPARAVLDAEITEHVEARLKRKQLDRLTEVDVTTVAGTVCLTGTASDVTDHAEAEKAARSVEGVQDVVNQLQIPIAQ